MDTIPPQSCSGCQRELPHTPEFFYARMRRCKACHNAAVLARRRLKNPAIAERAAAKERKLALAAVGLQACIKCREEKPATTEFFFAQKGGRLEGACKACRIKAQAAALTPEKKARKLEADARRRREATPEKKGQRTKQRLAWRAKNPEADAAAQRRWYEKNRHTQNERSRAYHTHNQERENARSKAWRLANPIAYRATQQAARARRRNAPGRYTAVDFERQFGLQGERCYWCGEGISLQGGDAATVDHLIPLAKGGTNAPNNIVCACKVCNRRKWANMPWDFNGRLL